MLYMPLGVLIPSLCHFWTLEGLFVAEVLLKQNKRHRNFVLSCYEWFL